MEEALKLRKWGNSNAIRLPKEMMKQVGIAPNDNEVSVNVTKCLKIMMVNLIRLKLLIKVMLLVKN